VPPPLQKLHARLLKGSVRRADAALEGRQSLNSYKLKSGLGFDGILYVSPPNQGPPNWLKFVRTGIEEELKEITNRTNAAVLVIRRKKRIFAFTFGHGRHLLKEGALEPDFGLKAALNGLRHDYLRSIDSFAVEEQTVHKRSQASRASGLEVFGVDVSRDILRAVTGVPLASVPLQAVSGTTSTLAIAVHTDFKGLGPVSDLLLSLYRKRSYREHFAWVDNVRRVTDPTTVESLESRLLEDLSGGTPRSYLAPPEPLEWDSVHQFGYTHRRKHRDLDMTLASYLGNIDEDSLTVETLQHHKVFAYDDAAAPPTKQWSVYDCLVFETSYEGGRFVLTAGEWFEVDRNFATEVNRILGEIPDADDLPLPEVRRNADGSLESEPIYNQRAVEDDHSIALLDRRTARCRGTSTGIEVCDLLTASGDLIHVKHRKGGSSTLSHLFAQGRMSGEALLRDSDFREDARRFLRGIRPSWARRIPVDKPDPGNYRVVFAILGADENHPGEGLPFFSQLNLVRTYEALKALGYRVGVKGVPVS
jgi:uncharacterized protein (TIGR04141 family)